MIYWVLPALAVAYLVLSVGLAFWACWALVNAATGDD